MPDSPLTTPPEPVASTTLRWTVHPAAHDRLRAALLIVILLAASGLAAAVLNRPAAGVAAFLLMFWSLRAWFLPRAYAVDAEGVVESGPLARPRRLNWETVQRAVPEPHGLYLSTRRSLSRWLPDRGLFLRTAGNREAVLAAVAARRPDAFRSA